MATYSELTAKVRKPQAWIKAFGWSDREDVTGRALTRPGPCQVAQVLSQPELKIAGLYRPAWIFRGEVKKIHEGMTGYGKYSKAERRSCRTPTRDYTRAVSGFMMRLRKAAPATDFDILEARLKHEFRIVTAGDRVLLLDFIRQLVGWALESRREGRPPDDSNILIYYVVNQLTYWKRGPDGSPLFDKRRRHKLERRWDDAAEMLIWLHYHQFPMPWLSSFIRKYAKADADRAVLDLKKIIQRRYSHLAHRAPIGRRGDPEGAFYPLGIRRVVAETDKFRAWEL
jgi:hypothetical protein